MITSGKFMGIHPSTVTSSASLFMSNRNKRSKDPMAFARKYKPNKFIRRTIIGLNVFWSLAISFLLFQSLQPLIGLPSAALLSLCIFAVTASFVLGANLALYKKVERKRFQDTLVSSDNIDILQQQLELCLEFGDVDKADRISRKLLRIAEDPAERAVS
jgi:hypothetical protein